MIFILAAFRNFFNFPGSSFLLLCNSYYKTKSKEREKIRPQIPHFWGFYKTFIQFGFLLFTSPLLFSFFISFEKVYICHLGGEIYLYV